MAISGSLGLTENLGSPLGSPKIAYPQSFFHFSSYPLVLLRMGGSAAWSWGRDGSVGLLPSSKPHQTWVGHGLRRAAGVSANTCPTCLTPSFHLHLLIWAREMGTCPPRAFVLWRKRKLRKDTATTALHVQKACSIQHIYFYCHKQTLEWQVHSYRKPEYLADKLQFQYFSIHF